MKVSDYISLVLYTFNDQSIINESLNRIINSLKSNFKNFEIIIINDFSSDNTLSICNKFKLENNEYSIKIINLSRKHGIEKCINVGVNYSIGDFVIEFDDPSLSFEDELILNLYNKSCEGYDIVSLKSENNRNFYSNIFYFILNKFIDKNVNEKLQTEYCYILSRRAINSMSLINNRIKYRKVLHPTLGFEKTSLYTDKNLNIKSSQSFEEKIELFLDVIFTSTNFAIKINIYLTLFFLVCTITVSLFSLYQYFFNESIVQGWTTTILYLSLSFFGVFLILSIISRLLSIILTEVGSIPNVTIKNINK